MLGAIYIGLSGMEAYSKGLQTISNNVANLDTLGYKQSTISFADLFNNGGAGLSYNSSSGQNESGSGVIFSTPSIDFSQGTLQQTSNSLDLSIQGGGFLVLQNSAGEKYFVRTGSFSVDQIGYISLQGGNYRLSTVSPTGAVTPINITNKQTSPPAPTTTVTLGNNLSSSATTADVPNVTVYDSTGAANVWDLSFAPTSGVTGGWTVTVKDSTGATIGTGNIAFTGGVVNPASSKVTITTTPTGADPLSVTLDFSNVTSYSAGTSSTLLVSSVDGNAVGSLSTVTIDQTGQVLLTYSNSQTLQLGAVAIADFRDPQKLTQISGGLFTNQAGGSVQYVASGVNGAGTLVSKQLESSNVDLSAEFGSLILIQRGFQASSQVISVTNDMIQELFGLRGHG